MTALIHVPRPEDDPEHRNPNTLGVKVPRSTQRMLAAERRVRVAQMLLLQVPQREIARRERVGLGTVGDDVKAIRAQWAERSIEAYGDLVAREIAKLDAREAVWLQKALDGDEKADLACDRIAQRRAKLLGIDQPAKAELTVSHVEVEDRRARARELLDAADELATKREAKIA